MGAPTVRGRASVCNWDLQFRFYDKSQCSRFIEKFMALESCGATNIKYHMIHGDSLTLDEHWVEIEEGCWAHNLIKIAKLLDEVDYKDIE